MFLSKLIYFILTAVVAIGVGALFMWLFRNKTQFSFNVKIFGAAVMAALVVFPLLVFATSVLVLDKGGAHYYELLGETDFELDNGKKVHVFNIGPGEFIINNSPDSFAIERTIFKRKAHTVNDGDLESILILIKPMSGLAFKGAKLDYVFEKTPEYLDGQMTQQSFTKLEFRYFNRGDWDNFYIYDGEINYGMPDGIGTLWEDKFTKKTGRFSAGVFKGD